jgi:hypothetical protein
MRPGGHGDARRGAATDRLAVSEGDHDLRHWRGTPVPD